MAIKLKTEREVASLRSPGKHSLGGNLYIQIGISDSRSWVARVTDHAGTRRDIGLGSCRGVTLKKAREKVGIVLAAVADGLDPVSALNPKPMPTFEQLALKVHSERAGSFKNAKHSAQWVTSLRTYAFPFIGPMPVNKVTSADVMNLLRPIWLEKPETARRVLQRVATVVSYAVPMGHRDSELAVNGIRKSLPRQIDRVRHHPAISVDDAPHAYRALADMGTTAALSLRLLMLCASRSLEVREACWSEIDLERAIWSIPGSRMKAGIAHQVPLSRHAVGLINQLPRIPNQRRLLFPNTRGNPLSDTALSKTFKQIAPGFTVHGCRSTFKVWAQEMTDYPDELSECALAHVNGDKTRAAYARSKLFEKRRALMEDWSKHLAT